MRKTFLFSVFLTDFLFFSTISAYNWRKDLKACEKELQGIEEKFDTHELHALNRLRSYWNLNGQQSNSTSTSNSNLLEDSSLLQDTIKAHCNDITISDKTNCVGTFETFSYGQLVKTDRKWIDQIDIYNDPSILSCSYQNAVSNAIFHVHLRRNRPLQKYMHCLNKIKAAMQPLNNCLSSQIDILENQYSDQKSQNDNLNKALAEQQEESSLKTVKFLQCKDTFLDLEKKFNETNQETIECYQKLEKCEKTSKNLENQVNVLLQTQLVSGAASGKKIQALDLKLKKCKSESLELQAKNQRLVANLNTANSTISELESEKAMLELQVLQNSNWKVQFENLQKNHTSLIQTSMVSGSVFSDQLANCKKETDAAKNKMSQLETEKVKILENLANRNKDFENLQEEFDKLVLEKQFLEQNLTQIKDENEDLKLRLQQKMSTDSIKPQGDELNKISRAANDEQEFGINPICELSTHVKSSFYQEKCLKKPVEIIEGTVDLSYDQGPFMVTISSHQNFAPGVTKYENSVFNEWTINFPISENSDSFDSSTSNSKYIALLEVVHLELEENTSRQNRNENRCYDSLTLIGLGPRRKICGNDLMGNIIPISLESGSLKGMFKSDSSQSLSGYKIIVRLVTNNEGMTGLNSIDGFDPIDAENHQEQIEVALNDEPEIIEKRPRMAVVKEIKIEVPAPTFVPTASSESQSKNIFTTTLEEKTVTTTKIPTIQVENVKCICENGIPAEDCSHGNQIKCQSCNDGFFGISCLKKICTCENGRASEGIYCPNNGTPKCNQKGCKAFYHFEDSDNSCQPNSCSCLNGTPEIHENCPFNGENRCRSCKIGYYLSNISDSCELNICKCKNGTGAIGGYCLENNDYECTSCNRGYELTNGACEKRKRRGWWG